MKIAGLQMKCARGPAANLAKAVEMIAMAAERGARLIATQQLFTLPWFAYESRKDPFRWAEPIDGPTVSTLQETAQKHGVVLVGTFFEKDGDSYFNTAAVIEKNGALIGRYRKVHLPQIPLWEEKSYFQSGDLGFPVFETSAARIGVQICWDNFFPEGSRIMALQGAQIIIAPTAAALASQSRWEKMISANAIANNVFILRINRAGKEDRQTFYGRSFCVNPYGELTTSPAGANDAIVFSEIDLNEVQETRDIWTFFRDRRPELYGELSRP